MSDFCIGDKVAIKPITRATGLQSGWDIRDVSAIGDFWRMYYIEWLDASVGEIVDRYQDEWVVRMSDGAQILASDAQLEYLAV